MGINNRTSIAIAILDYMCMHVDCLVQFTAHRSLCPTLAAVHFAHFRGGGLNVGCCAPIANARNIETILPAQSKSEAKQ